MTENELLIVEQKESIKLVKNTKGYNWEIKLLEIDLNRLETINNDMVKRFEIKIGDKNDNS